MTGSIRQARPRLWLFAAAGAAVWFLGAGAPAHATDEAAASDPRAARPTAESGRSSAPVARKAGTPAKRTTVSAHGARAKVKQARATQGRDAAAKPTRVAATNPDGSGSLHELSFTDEFDRAELIEQMLKECRGVPLNAYELAQTSGEPLWLPAPIQLMTVRSTNPYCAALLRTYAPKTAV